MIHEIAFLCVSFLQQFKIFFRLHLLCMQFFSSEKRLQEFFFSKSSPTLSPSLKSEMVGPLNISYLFVWSKKPVNPANPVAMPTSKTKFNILLMNILMRKSGQSFSSCFNLPKIAENCDASKSWCQQKTTLQSDILAPSKSKFFP